MKVVSKGLSEFEKWKILFGGPHPSVLPQGEKMFGLVSLTG
jgi:hypothetical protein